MLNALQNDLQKLATPEKAKALSWFFKTAEGQYGYGDQFLGVTVPEQRGIAKKYKDLPLEEIQKLLSSKFHEERLVALFILVLQFQKANENLKKKLYEFYLSHTEYINNWDLVDSSADRIVGEYLLDKDRSILTKLAKSKNLWEKRIAMIATYQFIKQGEYKDAFKIADILLNDKHDLLQKAVGWMLREVGKRVSQEKLIEFLKTRYSIMPRTTLRYAIEHFSPETRQKYLKGHI